MDDDINIGSQNDGEGMVLRDGGLPDALGGERIELGEGHRRHGREKRRYARFGGYLIISAFAVGAFIIMIFTLCSLHSEGDGELMAETEVTDVEQTQRVVYVQGDGEGFGGLSTPELYAACSDSVVSVLAKRNALGASGVGSGFVLSEDGYIATAAHVVEGFEELTVVLADGSEYSALLAAYDVFTDLALLKIDARGLRAIDWGESSRLETGERVVAIGTPASLDYAGSVCSGEVSYSERTVRIYDSESGALEKKMKLIQTSAQVNPGNSGCPLFNSEGRVVGIVTMKLGQNYAGVGFAIPSDGASAILCAMREGRELDGALLSAVSVHAPSLGIAAEAYETDGIYGVRVTGFSDGDHDSEQKLKVGDLITRIGDGARSAVTNAEELAEAVNEYSPDDVVSVTVYRNGQYLTFDVVLGM